MSYTPDALDPTRPTLPDDAGQLTGELRAIKSRLVTDKADIEALDTRVTAAEGSIAALGTLANVSHTVSTAAPNNAIGANGDFWFQYEV